MLYEHAYLDRGEKMDFLSRQFTPQQGAFKPRSYKEEVTPGSQH